MNNGKGFIQTPFFIAIIVGILILGGAGYFGVSQYKNSQENVTSFKLQNPKKAVVLDPTIIPQGASEEYTSVINKALASCGDDAQFIAIRDFWEASIKHIKNYYFGSEICGKFKIVYHIETATISDVESSSGGPFPWYDPIPLSDWNISRDDAVSIAEKSPSSREKPSVSLMNKDNQFHWLVDYISSDVVRFRIDAQTGEVLERRSFMLTL